MTMAHIDSAGGVTFSKESSAAEDIATSLGSVTNYCSSISLKKFRNPFSLDESLL